MKILTLIFLFLLFAFKIYGHGTIIIQSVEHEKGKIDVKIYMDKKSFLKEDLAVESIRKKPTKGETIIPLTKIHEGQIAIVVYHDEDGNGELKTKVVVEAIGATKGALAGVEKAGGTINLIKVAVSQPTENTQDASEST